MNEQEDLDALRAMLTKVHENIDQESIEYNDKMQCRAKILRSEFGMKAYNFNFRYALCCNDMFFDLDIGLFETSKLQIKHVETYLNTLDGNYEYGYNDKKDFILTNSEKNPTSHAIRSFICRKVER